MIAVVLAGLVTGMFMSAPVGPMAALAMLEVSRNRWRAALAVAGGVCVGGTLLGMLTLLLLHVPFELHVPVGLPELVGASVLLVLAAGIWKLADKPTTPAETHTFLATCIATLMHPGNILGYIVLYAATLSYFAETAADDLLVLEIILLVVSTAAGMLVGWVTLLVTVKAVVARFGKIPERLHVLMARCVSLLMAGTAGMLVLRAFAIV